jgi:hypothetical protein
VLQGSVEKYAAQKAEAAWYAALLERMTAMLVADAHDKGHAAAIDDTLKEGKPGDFNIQVGSSLFALLSPHQSGRFSSARSSAVAPTLTQSECVYVVWVGIRTVLRFRLHSCRSFPRWSDSHCATTTW